mmetsp:Transcript_17068/g.32676  ORF Transcript_17068/g.32676 Transcript_17068/m.32676 type:complete len:271 (-) Transcript_17068:434-1246(-)
MPAAADQRVRGIHRALAQRARSRFLVHIRNILCLAVRRRALLLGRGSISTSSRHNWRGSGIAARDMRVQTPLLVEGYQHARRAARASLQLVHGRPPRRVFRRDLPSPPALDVRLALLPVPLLLPPLVDGVEPVKAAALVLQLSRRASLNSGVRQRKAGNPGDGRARVGLPLVVWMRLGRGALQVERNVRYRTPETLLVPLHLQRVQRQARWALMLQHEVLELRPRLPQQRRHPLRARAGLASAASLALLCRVLQVVQLVLDRVGLLLSVG